MAVCTTKKAN
jgi:hypothetical protein